MKAIQISRPGAPLVLVNREIPQPGENQVRIKVKACGICHGDALVQEGMPFFNITYPRIPGHEIAGVIDKLGPAAEGWEIGQRVGVGWHYAACGTCWHCRRGDVACCKGRTITGMQVDGGYAEYMIASVQSLARIPEGLSFEEAAPLLCAGLASFGALAGSGARPGELVAILGVGGLGHLGIQFARKMGFRTVAVSIGKDSEKTALDLGAHAYIDADTTDAAQALQKMGGASVILATAANSKAIETALDGLRPTGKMMLVAGFPQPISIRTTQLVDVKCAIQGWNVGGPADSEEMLAFCMLQDIRPIIETFPLDQAPAAFERMVKSQTRFRAVLKMK
jgi:D-arabinose 1-dehydrogenase-like Zn-dependent alcohol dehydrogenase